MKAFRLLIVISAAVFVAACQDSVPSGTDIGGTDTAETDTDTDSDADTDADSDSDTDGPFAAVAYEWCGAGTTSCEVLNPDGWLLAGIGQLKAITLDGTFPIVFEATDIGAEGEFTDGQTAWVNYQGFILDFERGE